MSIYYDNWVRENTNIYLCDFPGCKTILLMILLFNIWSFFDDLNHQIVLRYNWGFFVKISLFYSHFERIRGHTVEIKGDRMGTTGHWKAIQHMVYDFGQDPGQFKRSLSGLLHHYSSYWTGANNQCRNSNYHFFSISSTCYDIQDVTPSKEDVH
jgi:hypothetical protein